MSAATTATDGQNGSSSEGRVTPQEAQAMLRAVLRLFDLWQLTSAEARVLLGEPAAKTFQRWRKGDAASIPHDTVFRLSTILGIHKALRHTFKDPEQGYEWIRRPSRAFGGQAALAKMLQGTPVDLVAVRHYLEAEQGAW